MRASTRNRANAWRPRSSSQAHLAPLSSLWLEGVHIGDEGLEDLAACPHLSGLTELHLEMNYLTPDGIRAPTTSKHLTRLHTLFLGCNELGEEGARLLAKWPGLSGLRVLDVSLCDLHEDGASILVRSKRLSGLTTLDISSNSLYPDGAVALAKARTLSALRTLDISDNRIEGEGVSALANSKHLTHLEMLNLSNNDVIDAGVIALANSKYIGAELYGLDLNDNWYPDSQAFAAPASSTTLGRLRGLNLSRCGMERQDVEELPAESKLDQLLWLDLSHNPLGDANIATLANWKGMNSVRHLILRETEMTEAGAAVVASSNLHHVSYLDVPMNDLSRKAKTALRKRFGKDSVLVDAD